MSGMICERRIEARVNRKFYKTIVRPAMKQSLELVKRTKRMWQS